MKKLIELKFIHKNEEPKMDKVLKRMFPNLDLGRQIVNANRICAYVQRLERFWGLHR